jgi:hypothetical protein
MGKSLLVVLFGLGGVVALGPWLNQRFFVRCQCGHRARLHVHGIYRCMADSACDCGFFKRGGDKA